jgi:hypothetical protein
VDIHGTAIRLPLGEGIAPPLVAQTTENKGLAEYGLRKVLKVDWLEVWQSKIAEGSGLPNGRKQMGCAAGFRPVAEVVHNRKKLRDLEEVGT